tara:strand:+ start:1126 stop:2133 length:1008 start_codon:yes stop_codon:yes gene_type:complete
MNKNIKNNSFLITGGTGSFGKAFVSKLINSNKKIKRLVIYSRDELKQFEMSQIFSKEKFPFIRYFIGDVRDGKRLKTAMEGIDTVIHAAALKQVPSTEYNPFEAIKTNIIGAQNIIENSISSNVHTVIALSTDKACAPVNLYGATKLCSDKLFISANKIKGNKSIRFSVVRYGNVFGSRGSVYRVFKNFLDKKYFPITHKDMTRFNITLAEGAHLVYDSLKKIYGGEIIVPKLKSFKITDLAKSMSSKNKIKFVGIRPGEKIHEQMISSSDSYNTVETKNFFAILPQGDDAILSYYKKKFSAKMTKRGFEYSSENNKPYMNIKEIKKIIENAEKN